MSAFFPKQGEYLSFLCACTEAYGLPRCVDGENACPPEDVEGTFGYAEFLAAISDRKHSEHQSYKEWCPHFDAKEFNLTKATRQMQRLKCTKWDVGSDSRYARCPRAKKERIDPVFAGEFDQ